MWCLEWVWFMKRAGLLVFWRQQPSKIRVLKSLLSDFDFLALFLKDLTIFTAPNWPWWSPDLRGFTLYITWVHLVTCRMNFSNLLDAKNMVNLSDWLFSYHLAPCHTFYAQHIKLFESSENRSIWLRNNHLNENHSFIWHFIV